ncbi:MAG: asparagine synthase-related protein [Planctomycetota bacterium]
MSELPGARPSSFEWRGHEPLEPLGEERTGWARGYAFVDGARPLVDGEIARYLADRSGSRDAAVAGLNGCFAAVVHSPDSTILATDRYGSVPVYVAEAGGCTYASDTFLPVARGLDAPPELDPAGVVDLLRLGYVLGTRTILRGVRTIGPSTVATIGSSGIDERRYWRYGYRPGASSPGGTTELAEVLRRVARRFVTLFEAQERVPTLTLSGGLDSRVLAALLRTASPGRIAAISYGEEGHPEIAVAREVADALGFDFDRVTLDRSYFDADYLSRAARRVGATTRLTCGVGADHLAPSRDAVYVPGHTGDFVSGGHLPREAGLVRSRADLRAFLEFRHVRYLGSDRALTEALDLDHRAIGRRSLDATIADLDVEGDVLGSIDRWNVENRQRRLILMELRSYEASGPWALPFYDHELVDHFAEIPHEQRIGQRLYVQTAIEQLFAGEAEALGTIRRVGGSLEPETRAYARLRAMQRTGPAGGLFLRQLLWRYRDARRRLRPRPAPKFGTDRLRTWYHEDARLRGFVDERLEALDGELIRADGLRRLLADPGAEERVFNRLLVGVLTVQETVDAASDTVSHTGAHPGFGKVPHTRPLRDE